MNRILAPRLAAIGAVLSLFLASCALQSEGPTATAAGPKLGLQTWACRNMNFDQVVEFAVKHGITHLVTNDNDFDRVPNLAVWKPR